MNRSEEVDELLDALGVFEINPLKPKGSLALQMAIRDVGYCLTIQYDPDRANVVVLICKTPRCISYGADCRDTKDAVLEAALMAWQNGEFRE